MLKGHVVGLEIGPGLIRAVQISRTLGGRIYVEKFLEVPLESGVDANGRITNVTLVSQELKRLWARAKFATKHVALGLGGTDVFVREFSVPEMKPENLKAALPALADGSLPMPTSEFMLDFYPAQISENSESRSVQGLLLAATKVATESLIDTIQLAGLKAQSIDLVPFAILRQLTEETKDNEVFCIVHASAGFLNVIVARGPVPLFIRIVPLPELKRNDVDKVVIHEEIGDQGEADSNSEELEDSSTEAVNQMLDPSYAIDDEFHEAAIRELRETLDYYATNHPETPITKLTTSGNGLDNSSWLTMLGQRIWLPAESHVQTEDYRDRSGSLKSHAIVVPTSYLVPLALAKAVTSG